MKRRARSVLLGAVLCTVFTSCSGWTRWPWGTTQLWPAPMEDTADPLPPGESYLLDEGPEEVLVLRHADPVKVRPTGFTAGYPLTFYQKSVRVHAGSAVASAPGGRAEILWPNGNSVVLFDRCAGVIGSPSKGQSSFIFVNCDRARLEVKVPDQFDLLAGARLSASSGPFILELVRQDILRVSNESKAFGEVHFRDAVIRLDPGQVVDLALLSAGAAPVQGAAGLQSAEGPGYTVRWSGSVELTREADEVRLRALGDHEIQANGVRVHLERDEVVRFEGMGKKE